MGTALNPLSVDLLHDLGGLRALEGLFERLISQALPSISDCDLILPSLLLDLPVSCLFSGGLTLIGQTISHYKTAR
jgi:hypothetical protein